MRRVLVGVVVALAALVSMPLARAQVTVVTGHPRLYLRPAEVTPLRTRAASAGIAPFYQQLKSRMDSTSTRHTNDEVAGFELESLALCHLIEAPSTTYRDKILAGWVRTGYAAGSMSHWDLPYQVMGHALALDWMWAELTAPERQTLADTLVALMDDLHAYAPHDSTWANQMSDYSNQLYYHLGALAFAGIVLSGEGLQDSAATGYLDEAEELLANHMIPAMNQEAGGDDDLTRTSGFTGNGGWGEDMGHLDMTHPLFGRMLEAWRTGTGVDLFPRANGIATLAQYLFYLRRPNGNLSPKGNGSYSMGTSDKNLGTLGCLTSARYGDRFGKTVKDLTWAGTTYGFHQVGAVLWYDDALAELDTASLPDALHFQGQGEVVVRSGFGANDTWVYLRSGPIYNGHQHDDQGNLLVEAYGGELLVENAGNEASTAGIGTTANHNALRVGGDQIPYGNNEVQYAQPVAGTPQERGRITAFTPTAEYTYAAADFGSAYPDAQVAPPKAGKVTRELVVILPDILVVRDRVSGTGIKEALWHAWAGGVVADAGQATLAITHGTGHAWVKTLLPQSPQQLLVSQGSTDQISITAASPTANGTFLHLIFLSPQSAATVPADVALIEEPGIVGAQVRDAGSDLWQVRFDADAVGLVSVTRNGAPIAPPDGGAQDGAGSDSGLMGDGTGGDPVAAADGSPVGDGASAATPGAVRGGCACRELRSEWARLMLVALLLVRTRLRRGSR